MSSEPHRAPPATASGRAADDAPARTVLVVDDSAFMRRVVTDLVESDPAFRVVGTATDGADALRRVRELDPQIVTLDVEMPVLNGLQALEQLMREAPRPVIMLSAAGAGSGDLLMRALELGAVDFVRKPSGPISLDLARARDRLMDALRAAASANLGVPALPSSGVAPAPTRGARPACAAERVVVIASSTGGPRALAEIVPRLPASLDAAVIVVQHMPSGFTASLARRLDGLSVLPVQEARDGEPLLAGHVVVAPGGSHLRLVCAADGVRLRLEETPTVWGVRPAADPLLDDAAGAFGAACLGVVLTGMGRDGAAGLRRVREAGGSALVQDASTATVAGMPSAALALAGADRVAPLHGMAAAITDAVPRLGARPL